MSLPFSALKRWAAIISATHCPRPNAGASLFVSTRMMTGASKSNWFGDRLTRKLHTPVSSSSAFTLKSIPEKKLICWVQCARSSNSTSATRSSDFAFSVFIAAAIDTLSANSVIKCARGVTGSMSAKMPIDWVSSS